MHSLRILSAIVFLTIGLTVLASTGAGWKWTHGHDSAPKERVAGWTWDEAAFF